VNGAKAEDFPTWKGIRPLTKTRRQRLADYRSLRAPVLMLAGSKMRAPIRRIGELLRFALPNATFDTMTTMGHMGPITRPGAIAQRIARFVRQHAFVPGPVARKLAA
jgi:pimeloyl-ACP methyl ester carboxylesterase